MFRSLFLIPRPSAPPLMGNGTTAQALVDLEYSPIHFQWPPLSHFILNARDDSFASWRKGHGLDRRASEEDGSGRKR